MKDEYMGVILNYRVGYRTQQTKECLIKVLDTELSEIRKLVGWKVHWPFESPKILGRITCLHGRSGTLRAKFSKGVPGQALSTRVKIIK